jgi:hypothetical protein
MKKTQTKTEANAPLMYIVQPDIKETKHSMQYFFSSSAAETPGETSEADEEKQTPQPKEEPTFSLISPIKEEKKKEEAKKANKMFQEMTIEEKAAFLAQFPKHMSQPVCEVKTKEKTSRGTITDVTKDELSLIIPPHKDPVSIPLQAVVEISIIKI